MIDLIKDIDGDAGIAANDLVLGVSDQQHREDLIMTEKGEIKQFPDAGVGARTYLESESPADLFREINLQYSADGMKVKSISINQVGNIVIEAPYEA